jgi:hypothetical protein
MNPQELPQKNPQEATPDDLVAGARAGLVYGEPPTREYLPGDPVMTLTLDQRQAVALGIVLRAVPIAGVPSLRDVRIRIDEALGISPD